MIYESVYPHYSPVVPMKVRVEPGQPQPTNKTYAHLKFRPGPAKPGTEGKLDRDRYGILDSTSGIIQKQTGMNQAEIEKCIEELPDYIDCQRGKTVGIAGVWRASERKAVTERASDKASVVSRFDQLGDPILMQIIVGAKMTAPVTASHAELVALAELATSPDRKAGDVAPPPAPQVPQQPPQLGVTTRSQLGVVAPPKPAETGAGTDAPPPAPQAAS